MRWVEIALWLAGIVALVYLGLVAYVIGVAWDAAMAELADENEQRWRW